jgi:glycosyltransferase involved in cell wall biosynthesis
MIVSSWTAKASKCHVTQLIGSDVNVVIPRLPATIARGWTKGLHGVISNSNQLAKRFSALYPKVPNVRIIPRGVNPELFNPAGSRLGPQADERPVRFAFFGGFQRRAFQPEYVKGGPTLLQAWKEVEANLASSGASLLLAGPASSNDLVRHWHATLRYQERVHIVGQVLPAEMAAGYLRAADAILIPSFEEGLPNVCMEAGACGRGVFGSAVGGIPDVIVHGETGLVIPAGDVRAWSDALVSYARQSESLREMGQRARARVRQLFDSRDYGARVLTVYDAALKSQSSGRTLALTFVSPSPTRAPAKPTGKPGLAEWCSPRAHPEAGASALRGRRHASMRIPTVSTLRPYNEARLYDRQAVLWAERGHSVHVVTRHLGERLDYNLSRV